MRLTRSLALGTMLITAVALYISPTSAQLSEPPGFVLEWRTGNPSMPWGIAAGDNDLIYVAHYQLSLVRVFTREGELVQTIGQLGSFPGEFLGPVGLALGPDGNLYVADSENSRVQVFTPEGEFVREFTHPEKFEVMFKPWGIAVDAAGNVFVSVLNRHEIHKFSPSGELQFTFGGFGPDPGEFVGPTGIAVSDEENELYVVDSLAFRIQVFDLNGNPKRNWGTLCDIYFTPGRGCVDPDGDGPLESGDGQFSSPWGIALDEMGRVYVADSANKRVQMFTPEGEFLTKWGELGTEAGNFDNNVGIAIDQYGDIFISDLNNNRVQRFAFPQPPEPEGEDENGDSEDEENGDDPPLILSTTLPEVSSVDGSIHTAQVLFQDLSANVTSAQIRVIDGKYDPIFLDLSHLNGVTEGQFSFEYACQIPQNLVLKLELFDAVGNRSDPERIDIACGEPLLGNYNAEQETLRQTERSIRFNLIVIDDGLTTLSDGALFTDESAQVALAPADLREAIEDDVVPAVTGIWDQCALSFELASLLVVDPQEIVLEEVSLDEALFFRTGQLPEVALNESSRIRPLVLLEDALVPITSAAIALGIPFEPALVTVYVAGARIVSQAGDERHYGGVTTLNGSVSLVRWDDVMFTDDERSMIVAPTRIITAIAHEIGHNLGLIHSNDDVSTAINSDPFNLMLSNPEQPTAVPPEPTVNLVEEQCEQAEPRVAELSLIQ